jgi:hypothetical protein
MMFTILVKFMIGEECSTHLMMRDMYENVVEKPEGKRPFRRPSRGS